PIVRELKPVLDLVEVAISIVGKPFGDHIAIGLLGILHNEIAGYISAGAALAAIHEEVYVAPVVIDYPYLVEDDIRALFGLGRVVAGGGVAGIAWIVDDRIGVAKEFVVGRIIQHIVHALAAGRTGSHLAAVPRAAGVERP